MQIKNTLLNLRLLKKAHTPYTLLVKVKHLQLQHSVLELLLNVEQLQNPLQHQVQVVDQVVVEDLSQNGHTPIGVIVMFLYNREE